MKSVVKITETIEYLYAIEGEDSEDIRKIAYAKWLRDDKIGQLQKETSTKYTVIKEGIEGAYSELYTSP